MYASDDKVECTPCHEVNILGVRASRVVNISTQWADGNITFYGSTRTVQPSFFEKRSVSTGTQKRTKMLLIF